MIHTVLPVQYLRDGGEGLAEPARRLAFAVLQTVLYDCRAIDAKMPDGPVRARDREAYRRAMAYVESTDRSWPYSFENLCDSLGVDPEWLRRGISQQQTAAA